MAGMGLLCVVQQEAQRAQSQESPDIPEMSQGFFASSVVWNANLERPTHLDERR